MIAGNSKEDLYGHHPAIYILTFGLIAAKVTNRLVVSLKYRYVTYQVQMLLVF